MHLMAREKKTCNSAHVSSDNAIFLGLCIPELKPGAQLYDSRIRPESLPLRAGYMGRGRAVTCMYTMLAAKRNHR